MFLVTFINDDFEFHEKHDMWVNYRGCIIAPTLSCIVTVQTCHMYITILKQF